MDLSRFSKDIAIQQQLEDGLREAYSIHVQWLEYFGKGIDLGHKGFKEEIQKLRKALLKLEEERGSDSAAIKSINAAIKFIPAIDLEYFDSFLDGFEPTENPGRFISYIDSLQYDGKHKKEIANKLLVAVDRVINELNTVGRGGANKRASKYAEGLKELKYHFSNSLPGFSVSGARGTVFWDYVRIWFENYLQETHPENITRLIDRASQK